MKYRVLFLSFSRLLMAYAIAYLILSRIGMVEGVEVGREQKPLIWTFGGCHQSIGRYLCTTCREYDPKQVIKEKRLITIFYPLVQGDRLLGNYHLLDEDIPYFSQ